VIYRTFEALERQGSDLFGGARKVVLVRACIVRCREREIYGERRWKKEKEREEEKEVFGAGKMEELRKGRKEGEEDGEKCGSEE